MIALLTLGGVAFADPMSSTSYQADEAYFGTGGELDASSDNYRSKQAAGELTVGNTQSDGFQAQAGFNSDRYPYLEFKVDAASIDIGTLVPGTPVTANATFSVRSYLSSGYIVQTASLPPRNGTHLLDAITNTALPDNDREQFGINLAANTSPRTFGAAPVQSPDSSFSFGRAAPGYDVPNQFKYVKDDTIAYANSSSGETDYTISYLFNITGVTPGGVYNMIHVLVATATF